MFTKLFLTAASFWGDCLAGDQKDVATLKCVPVLFKQLLNYAFFFAGFVALVFLIIGGIRYITSGGDPKQAGAAKQVITYAILGLVIILLSIAAVNTLAYITNTECIKTFDFTSCQ